MIVSVFVLSALLGAALVVIIRGLDREARLRRLVSESLHGQSEALEQNVALRFALREARDRADVLAHCLEGQREENADLVMWLGHLTSEHSVVYYKPRADGIGPN